MRKCTLTAGMFSTINQQGQREKQLYHLELKKALRINTIQAIC